MRLPCLPDLDVKDLARRLEEESTSFVRNQLANTLKTVGKAVVDAAKTVGNGVVDTANTVASGAKSFFRGVGKLFNEPIAGADVFFDANFNGVRDGNEPVTQTASDGSYAIDLDMSLFDKNQNDRINSNEGQWVGTGGYDSYAGLAQQQTFVAAGNAIAITPLTTLVSEMMQQGMNQYRAQEKINAALGLPKDTDLGGFIPALAIAKKDPLGAQVEVAQSQVTNLLVQTTKLLGGASNLSKQQINQSVIEAVVSQIQPGATISLSNADDVTAILKAAVKNLQDADSNSKVQKLQSVLSQVAEVMAAGNLKLEEIAAKGDFKTLLEELGAVRKVTLGKIAEDLESVGAGEKSIQAFTSETTGDAFDQLITEAAQSFTQGTNRDDMLRGSNKKDNLNGRAGNDQILGGAGKDEIFGSDNNDVLFGENGKDQLEGGSGKDTLTGGLQADRLLGGNGNDVLTGGGGKDLLVGGKGQDRFRLGEAGIDRILDFTQQDILEIVGLASITGAKAGQAISPENFHLGSLAQDGDDYLIYNQTSGALFFDADGNGTTQQVQLAKLTAGSMLLPQNVWLA